MSDLHGKKLSPERLLAIISTQQEIMSADLRLDAVLQLVVARAPALMRRASGGVVELREGDEMVYRAVSGTANGWLGTRTRADATLAGLCVQLATPLSCADTARDARVEKELCQQIGIGSMICVPLFHQHRTVGALKLIAQETSAFDEDDIEVLQLLANVIAVAMVHAVAFELKDHESRHDALTRLPNRRAFDERLAEEHARAQRYRRPLTLVLLDLDGFKLANDRFGHPYGDQILRDVAALLAREVRKSDLCFRIGGDEFAILMPETPRDAAKIAVARCLEAVRRALIGGGTVGLSAGIAEAGEEDAAGLHARADAELYAAKARNKGSLRAALARLERLDRTI